MNGVTASPKHRLDNGHNSPKAATSDVFFRLEQPSGTIKKNNVSYCSIMDTKQKKQHLLIWCIIGIILIADQALKIWVKTHMYIGEEIPLIGDWFVLHFVENEGFAFGMKFGGATGKVLLTLFRLVASLALLVALPLLIKRGARTGFIAYMALITAGAVGNLIDCCFYGVLFNESTYSVAQMFPPEGYAPLLQGRVVDMFFAPMIDTTLPAGFPIWGGQHILFFSAIFNIADSAITVGCFWLIIDQLVQNFKKKKNAEKEVSETGENDEK